MLWVYGKYKYFYSYSAGMDFSLSESDVYRRQILTTKVDPRAVWVNSLLYGFMNICSCQECKIELLSMDTF